MTHAELATTLSDETGLPLVDLLDMSPRELDALYWDDAPEFDFSLDVAPDAEFDPNERFEILNDFDGAEQHGYAEYLAELADEAEGDT